MSNVQRSYGWVKDKRDERDHRLVLPTAARTAPLPQKIDLSSIMPPIYNQLQLGACTGNGVARCMEAAAMRQGKPIVTPSRLYIYLKERIIENTVNQDAGAEIRDGIKAVNKWGVPDEEFWPYIPSKFAVIPPASVDALAKYHRAVAYKSVDQNLRYIVACLEAKKPVVFGTTVYESFESEEVAANGIVPMPSPGEASVGGHCMVITGHDLSTQLFQVDNSWGADWGVKGRCFMPMAYLLDPNQANDFWQIDWVSV